MTPLNCYMLRPLRNFCRSPCLRSLRLVSCYDVTDIGFTEVVKALPLLEELEISLCDNVGADGVFEVEVEVCPQRKRFRLSRPHFSYGVKNKDKDALGIANMRGLCSLQLFGNALSNKGLETILDNCPHLECLDIHRCFNIDMNETLLARCSRIKTINSFPVTQLMTMIPTRLKALAWEALPGQIQGALTHGLFQVIITTSTMIIMIDLFPHFQDDGRRGRGHQTVFSIVVACSHLLS